MIRISVLMAGILFFTGVSPHSSAQMRFEQGFVAFNGRTYQVPTSGQPCNSATFNDHGMSVRLCVDNFGVPMAAIPLPQVTAPAPAPGRAPASTGAH